jgi:hypothetical protein
MLNHLLGLPGVGRDLFRFSNGSMSCGLHIQVVVRNFRYAETLVKQKIVQYT